MRCCTSRSDGLSFKEGGENCPFPRLWWRRFLLLQNLSSLHKRRALIVAYALYIAVLPAVFPCAHEKIRIFLAALKSVMPGTVLVLLLSASLPVEADRVYPSIISDIRGSRAQDRFIVSVRVKYGLSPAAKEAISKGVPLAWEIQIRLRRKTWLWDWAVFELNLPWSIQYQALLNQYSVKNLHSGHQEVFASLSTALDYMGDVQGMVLPDEDIVGNSDYFLAVRVVFVREHLPVPLRPESYFDPQWDLSSDWLIWPLQE